MKEKDTQLWGLYAILFELQPHSTLEETPCKADHKCCLAWMVRVCICQQVAQGISLCSSRALRLRECLIGWSCLSGGTRRSGTIQVDTGGGLPSCEALAMLLEKIVTRKYRLGTTPHGHGEGKISSR